MLINNTFISGQHIEGHDSFKQIHTAGSKGKKVRVPYYIQDCEWGTHLPFLAVQLTVEYTTVFVMHGLSNKTAVTFPAAQHSPWPALIFHFAEHRKLSGPECLVYTPSRH